MKANILKNINQSVMKTKLYAPILPALTLAGSRFAQASKPLAELQQKFLSWKVGFMICHLTTSRVSQRRESVSHAIESQWPGVAALIVLQRSHMIKELVTVITIMLTTCALHAAEYHVSPDGLDSNEGSKSKPFKTISAAAHIAQPGDVITVHEGTYRERVNPPRGGTSDDQRIVYQAAPGEKVVIKGSEIVNGWEKVQNNTWKATLPNSLFGNYNPYGDVIKGEWHADKEYPRHTGTVYLNGMWMNEAKTLEQGLAPIGERPFWIAKTEKEHTTIWAQFKDVDPNTELVEINVRQSVFYPDQPGRNYITVRGFTMCQAATPWSGAMSEQIGLVGTHWSKGWVIESNVISHSMNTGITLGRYDLDKFGIAMPAASAPGFVKSCELAIEHGWSKEKIGGHVIRNNHISHCEKNGIHGSLGGIFSTIEGNTIHDIAMKGWIGGPDVAGLKLLASNDAIIRNNHIFRCLGSGGIWLDWMAQGTRVTGNLLHENSRDIFMEVNHGPFLIDNNLLLSKRSISDWSQGAAYVHNLIAGRIDSRPEERETPYFRPHTVQDMKLSSIKHKDARYYNNLLLGQSRLPEGGNAENLQTAGNHHLEGVDVKLEEKADGLWAIVPLMPAAEKRAVVTTEVLGKAKIPDAPFENPDSTPYRLETDYFGNKRISENPAPGPFATQGDKESRLKVWPKK
jgi:alpha-N-arabinofuranosidase